MRNVVHSSIQEAAWWMLDMETKHLQSLFIEGMSKDPAWCNSLLTILKIHVWVEHAFAALKGCFQSLRELRLKMKTDDNLHIAVYWITCCMILHNMVVCFETRRREELGEGTMRWAIWEAEWEDNDDEGREERGGTPGQQFRGLLMERLFEQHGIRV